mgnify:CR=1 FL=1
METRYLKTLLTVVETSSLAETARRLNITPSAVVQRIRALEDEIGQALIQRSGHSMQPTMAAAAVLPGIRRLLDMESEVKAATVRNDDAGMLRVGVLHSAVGGLLPEVLAGMHRNRPKIELYVVPGTSAELHSDVTSGNLDVAILVQPHFALPKTLDWLLLRRQRLVLITPPEMTETDPRAVLEGAAFIRYDRNRWGGRLADLQLRRMKIRPQEQYEIDSLHAITCLVARGVGVSLVPDWLPPWPQDAQVRRILLDEAATLDLGLLWSKTAPCLPRIRAFVDETEVVARGKAYLGSC